MLHDYDAILIGGGPAGLTAGLYLTRSRRNTLLVAEKIFDGPVADLESIENYPGYAEPISGAQLISDLATQAMNYGLQIEEALVEAVNPLADGCQVIYSDGRVLTSTILIIATGTYHRKLGVPGETEYWGKGIFNCSLCDGHKYKGQIVAVCGGGDAGVTEALYMAKIASKVILIEMMSTLTACGILKERVEENSNIEVLCGAKVNSIIGETKVQGINIERQGGVAENIPVDGILVQIGLIPNTAFLKNVVALNDSKHIIVNEKMETNVFNILAAGDVRSASPNQIVTATGDGATAAITAEKILQQLIG